MAGAGGSGVSRDEQSGLKLLLQSLFLALVIAAPARAIVNGTPASEETFAAQYPWAVALVNAEAEGVCTGQLISPTWVLTAAHCTSLGMHPVIGYANRLSGVPIEPVEAIPHPRYDSERGDYDIGLIRLPQPVAVRPVALMTVAEARTLLTADARAIIAGWGKRSPSLPHSERFIVSDVELRELMIDGTRIIYFDPVSGPCGGDSGGPLLLTRADGSRVLAGVASRVVGDLCAQGGGVGVYVNVAEVRDFIRRHVRDLPRR